MTGLPLQPDGAALAACAQALRNGEPVIIPTDTVYGLAARASDTDAIARIFELKRRPVDRSLAVLVADVEQAAELAVLDARSRRLVEAFWPGALTVVVDRQAAQLADLSADDGTIGLRSPAHEFVRRLAADVGPIAATSANIHGQPTPADAAGVAEIFSAEGVVVVDGGRLGGAASTVVDARHEPIIVHRTGPITEAELRQALG